MNTTTPDWIYLPQGIKETSLWNSLHDAKLCAITSKRLERTVDITFSIPHLQNHLGTNEEAKFIFCLEGVASVRAIASVPWPGPEPKFEKGTPREDAQRLIEDYWAKWREESVNWNDLENMLSTEAASIEIEDASLASTMEVASIHLVGTHEKSNRPYNISIRATRLNVALSNGRSFTLDQFIELGDAFWRAFAARSPSSQK